uniref:hypothetical protein n=1 Tax=Holdemanella sp. TaxID=1971762 RepID=UPI00258B8F97
EKEKISSSSYKEANKLTHFGIIECDNNYFYYAYHNQLLKVKKSLDSDPILLFKADESDIKNICIHEDYIYFTAPTLQRIDKGGNNFCELTIEYDSDALSAANSIRQSKHLTEITSTQILEPQRIICTGDYLYVFSTENFLSRKSWLENSLTIDLSRIDSSSPSGWIYDIKNDPTSVKPISNVSNLVNQSSYPLIAIIGAPFGNYEYSISISDGDVNGNTIVSLVNLTENEEILKESGDPSLILEHTQYLPHSDCIFYILFYNKDPGIYMCDLNGNESKKLIETTDNMFYLLDSDETYLYYVHIIPNYSDINQRSTIDIEYHMFDYHTYTDTCFLYTADNIDNFSSTDMSNLPVICDGTIYFPTSFENDEMSNILLYNIVSKNQLKAS